MYVQSKGCYVRLHLVDLRSVTSTLLRRVMGDLFNSKLMNDVWNEIKESKLTCIGSPRVSTKYNVFSNITVDISTFKRQNYSQEIFTTHTLDFPYDESQSDCFVFNKFIDDLSDGKEDRTTYLLCIMNIILLSKIHYQVIFYLYGPGASGKSQFTTLLKALIGTPSIMSTTLDALSSDGFAVINFIGKTLVLINDTSGKLKESSTIKPYNGGDELRGRTMFNAITENILPEGIMFIVGNEPLTLDKGDYNDGMARRLKSYETVRTTTNRSPLIARNENGWHGLLVPELPAIYNKVTLLNSDLVDQYITFNEKYIHSLGAVFSLTNKILNTVAAWMYEELEPINGRTLVGFITKDCKSAAYAEGRFLWATYLSLHTWWKTQQKNMDGSLLKAEQALEYLWKVLVLNLVLVSMHIN